MRIFISYFYQVRFFRKDILAFSTAHFDPQWFHQGWNKRKVYLNDSGVLIGLRADNLVPGKSCEGLCQGNCIPRTPDSCEFLKAYRRQLDQIDFKEFIDSLEKACQDYQKKNGLFDTDVVFLVHEAPDNPCSERSVLFDWFRSNGVEVEEWNRNFLV